MVLRIVGPWVRAASSPSSCSCFVLMCGMIAWSQWYAIHVNVPMYRAQHGPATTH